MSNQQPSGAWQTAGRQRQSQSASRTPQNRSNTASPNQQNVPPLSPRQDGGRSLQPTNNVWTQRSSSASGSGSNGPTRPDTSAQDDAGSLNGFNTADVKAFLSRDVGSVAVYKPAEASGGARSSGVWGSKPNTMANNQTFFPQLAKQIATFEGGG